MTRLELIILANRVHVMYLAFFINWIGKSSISHDLVVLSLFTFAIVSYSSVSSKKEI